MTEYQFQQFIFDLCKTFNASISSMHRTVRHNKDVGGATNSQHLGFKAADLVLDDVDLNKSKVLRLCAERGLWTLDEKDHLHIDDRNNADGR